MILKRWFMVLAILLPFAVSMAPSPPDHLVPPPILGQHRHPHKLQLPPQVSPKSEDPGFMQRIAQWFGFTSSEARARDQQVQATYQKPQYKAIPLQHVGHQPVQLQHPAQYAVQYRGEHCNLCNKAPWIPMFPSVVGYAVSKHYVPIENTQDQPPLTLYSPQQLLPNYAAAYNFKENRIIDYSAAPRGKRPFLQALDQNVEILNSNQLPPIYDPVVFNEHARGNAADLFEPIPAHSQFQEVLPPKSSSNMPTTSPLQTQTGVEILKSVPLREFTSSIEYPATIEQSPLIDLSNDRSSLPDVTKEIPRLTELGSFSPTSAAPELEFISERIIVNQQPSLEFSDSYPEASSHNLSYRHENGLDTGNYEIFFTESTTEFETTYRPEKVVPLKQDASERAQPLLENASQKSRPFKKDRETPKEYLDSPIFYNHGNAGSSPRPFTRDPSDMKIVSSTYTNKAWEPSPTPTPWAYAPTPTSTYTNLDASGLYAGMQPPGIFVTNTRTSNQYSTLSPTITTIPQNPQASSSQPFVTAPRPQYVTPSRNQHQFVTGFKENGPATIRQTSANEKRPKHIHQIIIPYRSKILPSPFRTREEQTAHENSEESRYSNWSNSHEIDHHEQQESKHVTATEQPITKTTKYLTKILAANLRDLLKREHQHMTQNRTERNGFDILKLQKNIDGWTEQEYTAIGRKATTLAVGRSKNIPKEYLTTTTPMNSFQSIEFSTNTEIPTTTITNYSDGLLNDEELAKYDFLAKFVENNQIGQIYNPKENMKETEASSSSSSTTIPTASTDQPITPLFIRTIVPTPSSELWDRLKLSISPITKEKVYVVTPQPKTYFKSTATVDTPGTFKSPRFLVRPAPANGAIVPSSTPRPFSSSSYTPELFGLMGISAYSPQSPVETFAGHSKVITVVTPASNIKRSFLSNSEIADINKSSVSPEDRTTIKPANS